MSSLRNQLIAMSVGAVAAVGLTGGGEIQATTVPPALPGGAANQFSGDWVNGANGANQSLVTLTDNNLDSTYNTPNNDSYPIYIAVFAQPASPTPPASNPNGTFAAINLLREHALETAI